MKQGSMTEARMTKSVITIRPYSKVSANKYFQEMKPLLMLQRMLGSLPYSLDKQGFAPFKLFSFPVLYTVVFYTVNSAWTIYSMSVIAKKKIFNAPSYDVALFWVSIGLILLLNLITPITKWIDMHKYVQFISSWQNFQDHLMNSELEMTLSKRIMMTAVFILPIALAFVSFQSYLLTDLSLAIMFPFITAVSSAVVTLVHWCSTLCELRTASRLLISKIITNECRQMSRYRRTWLELSKLVSAVGKYHAITGMALRLIFLTSLILTTYALLSSIFESATVCSNFWGLLFAAFTGFLSDFILCDAAHRTTQEVGPEFISKILELDLTHLGQGDINEVSLLLQTVTAKPPSVGYLGFVTINRSLFVSNISRTVTYLVVLVQFTTVSK